MRIELTHTASLLVVAGLTSCSSEEGANDGTSETGGTAAVPGSGGASTGGTPATGELLASPTWP
jgi:hypothetical protein